MSLKTLGQKNPDDRILIFDEFRVDKDLPKFKAEREEAERNGEKQKRGNINISTQGTWLMNEADVSEDGDEEDFTNNPNTKSRNYRDVTVRGALPWWKRMWSKPKPTPKAPPVPVKYVFDLVLSNPEELKVYKERGDAFQEMLANAKAAGQKSLIVQLEAEREIRNFENALFAKGMKKYISEAQLLKFVRGCERGLCLDWVRNFTRVIPKEVVAAKVRCDEAGLFDNYVVLHFDPENKGTTKEDRAAEEARKRDPILFGVMRGSRKLYFVGDWVDEFCDLTFQQLVDKLGDPLEIK